VVADGALARHPLRSCSCEACKGWQRAGPRRAAMRRDLRKEIAETFEPGPDRPQDPVP
jgi:hypothetical protein